MERVLNEAGTSSLLALQSDVRPDEYTLGTEVCILGRATTCQVYVPGQLISREHAKIERTGLRYLLTDLGSMNGTFVNGSRLLAPHLLANDDVIGLGSSTSQLRFLDPDPTVPGNATLRYDERAMLFRLKTHDLKLTPTQFRLLLHLYQHAGEVCSRESCAQAIWGQEYEPGRDAGALDQVFNNLRTALRKADPTTNFIQTRRNLGYVLVL